MLHYTVFLEKGVIIGSITVCSRTQKTFHYYLYFFCTTREVIAGPTSISAIKFMKYKYEVMQGRKSGPNYPSITFVYRMV